MLLQQIVYNSKQKLKLKLTYYNFFSSKDLVLNNENPHMKYQTSKTKLLVYCFVFMDIIMKNCYVLYR